MAFDGLSLDRKLRINTICREFEESRYEDPPPALSSFLGRVSIEDRDATLRELLAIEFELRLANSDEVAVSEYLDLFPNDTVLVSSVYQEVQDSLAESPSRDDIPLPKYGDYQLIREVGRGGMGVVYEALQISLNRRVALKVLPRHMFGDTLRRGRFEREALAAGKLHHTNIVQVFGVGECEDQVFYVMQFIDGQPLDQWLKRQSFVPQPAAKTPLAGTTFASKETVPEGVGSSPATDLISPTRRTPQRITALEQAHWRKVAEIGVQVSSALDHAHQQAVLHRDIKPANLLIDQQGTVWVTDFGLAKVTDERDLTQSGDVLGTVRYMAPETFKGQFDSRSEVFSLGLTLYELLALRPAYDETNRQALMEQAVNGRFAPLEQIKPPLPRDLRTIIHKAIDREPAGRYQTAGEFADDLTRFLRDEPIHARRVSSSEHLWRWAGRNKVLAWSLMTTMTLLVLGMISSLIAAAHFQGLEAQQRELTNEKSALAESNGLLAEKNSDLASSNAQLANEARQELERATLMVSDVFTQQGLQAAAAGRDREALLWFAHAGLKSDTLDHERTRKSQVRYRRLSNQMARPVAVLKHTFDVERLMIHPNHRYVLLRPIRSQAGAIWDVTTEQAVELPSSVLPAYGLAWSPDGKWLAIGGDDRVSVLPFPECVESPERFNRPSPSDASPEQTALDGKSALRVIPTPKGQIKRLEFDSTGRFLALAATWTARVWDLQDEGYICPPLEHKYNIAGLILSPDHRRLATFGNKQFQVFELGESGHVPITTATASVSGAHYFSTTWTYMLPQFVRQGKALLVLPDRNLMQVWNLESRKAEKIFAVPDISHIHCIEPLGNDEFLVGGLGSRQVISAGIEDQIRAKVVLQPAASNCMTAAYDLGTDQLFLGFAGHDNEIWSREDCRPLPCSITPLDGCLASAFSSDGRMLATSTYGRDLTIWEMPASSTEDALPSATSANTQKLPIRRGRDFSVRLDNTVHHAAFSADSRLLAVTSTIENAHLYDLQTLQRVAQLKTPPRAGFHSIQRPYFLPAPELLAVDTRRTNTRRELEIWNWQTGECEKTGEYPCSNSNEQGDQPRQTANKNFLLAFGDSANGSFFDLRSKDRIKSRQFVDSTVHQWFDISPDGNWLGISTEGGWCGGLHNVATNTHVASFRHERPLHSVRFSADGARVATCGWDNNVNVWDPTTGSLVIGPLAHSSAVYEAEFSSDNRYLLTFAKDATARVWNLSTGQMAAPPFAGQDDIGAAFRPGSNQVVVIDSAGWLHIWDWKNSTRLWPSMRLSTIDRPIWTNMRSLVLSPDGRYAAMASEKAVHVIDLTPLDDNTSNPPADLITEAELLSGHRLTENGAAVKLTTEEWKLRIPRRPQPAKR